MALPQPSDVTVTREHTTPLVQADGTSKVVLADGSGNLVLSFGQSKLSWASVTGASDYAVFRSNGHASTYSEIARVSDPTTEYDDEHNTERQIYSYKVAAVDDAPVIGKRTPAIHTSGLNTNL